MLHREANDKDFAIATAAGTVRLRHEFSHPRPPLESTLAGCEADDGLCSGGENRMRRRVKLATEDGHRDRDRGGAIASVPPSTWREAEGALRRHMRSVETLVQPAAERSAQWFESQTHALWDRLDGLKSEPGRLPRPGRNSRFGSCGVLLHSRVPRG